MSYPDSRYLEIGCWKGSTLTAALYNNNPAYHMAIESFGECESDIQPTLEKNCMRVLGKRPNFMFTDCFSVDCKANKIENINVYFYDGNHSRESTRKGITYYYDAMAPEFILLVDDWNRLEVEEGIIEGLAETNPIIDFVRILPAMGDGDLENWWSGLFVASCKKR
jgi:hypothetical protein